MLDRALINWPLKALSLALAFAIWVFVSGEKQSVQDFNVPLDMRLPAHLALMDTPPTTVSVRLRGPESLIRRLDPVVMDMSVALDDLPLGEQDVALSKSDLAGVPRGVDVDFVEPDRVRVNLDDRGQRKFTLDVAFLGQPPEGYSFYGAHVTPDTLTLEGPRTKLAAVERLETTPVRLDQQTAPFTATLRATPDHPSLRVVETEPVTVRVEVDVAPVDRTFSGVPVVAIGQEYETLVTPGESAITVSGPPALLERLKQRQLRLVVDVGGLPPSDQPRLLPLRLDLIDVPVEELSRISMKSAGRLHVSVQVTERRLR